MACVPIPCGHIGGVAILPEGTGAAGTGGWEILVEDMCWC